MRSTLAERLSLALPSPLERLAHPLFAAHKVQVWAKRDDLIHPVISGNKWRKLQGVLAQLPVGTKRLLSFGGAYSNHLYALAEVGQHTGHATVGLVRGEPRLPLNSTLAHAQRCGMQLCYVDRQTYRLRHRPDYLAALQAEWGPETHIIPEGGACPAALPSVGALLGEIRQDFEAIYCPCGSGGTSAGLALALTFEQCCYSIPVLKGGAGLYSDIVALAPELAASFGQRWQLLCDYHFGGYARHSPELMAFIDDCAQRWGLPLEPVYSAKALFALVDQVRRGRHPAGSRIIFLHTGGLRASDMP